MNPDLTLLQVYHFAVSVAGALGAVMVMQIVGREWTTSWQSAALQHLQRVGLGVLSIALFCSAVRLPAIIHCGHVPLLSAAAVNTAIFLIMVPTALIGRAHMTSATR